MRKIHAISYQRKITGYSKDFCFPTEMTVVYIVGEMAGMIGPLQKKVLEIKEVSDGFDVEFDGGYTLCISDKKDIDVLYADK